jgi:pimeloyl-ACP methyl ester carboxylesterase
VLADIHVPTLVIHRVDDGLIPVEAGRLIAERVEGAVYVELPGADHFPFLTDMDPVVDELEAFVAAVREGSGKARV